MRTMRRVRVLLLEPALNVGLPLAVLWALISYSSIGPNILEDGRGTVFVVVVWVGWRFARAIADVRAIVTERRETRELFRRTAHLVDGLRVGPGLTGAPADPFGGHAPVSTCAPRRPLRAEGDHLDQVFGVDVFEGLAGGEVVAGVKAA